MCPVCVRPLQLATMMIGRQRLFRKTRKYWQVFDLNQQWLFRIDYISVVSVRCSWSMQVGRLRLYQKSSEVWNTYLTTKGRFEKCDWSLKKISALHGTGVKCCQWSCFVSDIQWWSCFVSDIQWWSCFVSDIQWWSCFVSDIQQFWSCQCGLELVALNRQMFWSLRFLFAGRVGMEQNVEASRQVLCYILLITKAVLEQKLIQVQSDWCFVLSLMIGRQRLFQKNLKCCPRLSLFHKTCDW